MNPDLNWRRAVEAGVSGLLCPIKTEAHALPFAQGFFDAVLSVDAFQYFGTDELYIDYLSRFVKPSGTLGVVVVGLTKELGPEPPACLTEPQKNGKVFWEASCRSFKAREFWHGLWSRSPMVVDVKVEAQQDGWRHWRDFEQAIEAAGKGAFPTDAEALDRDRGETLCFLRLTARRTDAIGEDLYDPALGAKVGVDR
jgi:cyclopropane fatty-acyl-phospholipid synthase-like methyltransferase